MEAWVTLATNDAYSMGALTLAASLKRVNTSRKLAIMVTSEVSSPVLAALEEAFDQVVVVEPLDSKDLAHLTLLDRTELGITFTKINCWKLTQFSKAVFLDADTLVLKNSDELFEREEFSAAPDAGWPDCFNSGVFVFRPNLNTYNELVALATTTGSFDGGDQGLLNTHFSSWATQDISKHLPFLYNMVSSASYSYLPAFKKFGSDVKIIHFIGAEKPWLGGEGGSSSSTLPGAEHRKLWWQLYSTQVAPQLSLKREGVALNPSPLSPAPSSASTYCQPSPSPPPVPQDSSRESWERGQPDYNGAASFDNILKKINKTMSK